MFSKITMVPLTMVFLSANALNIVKTRSDSTGPTVQEAAQQCGNGQTISCCNTSTSDSAGGLLDVDALNGILGGSCTAIPVNVLGVQAPLEQECSGNQAACCTGSQSGLVDIQCTPINV